MWQIISSFNYSAIVAPSWIITKEGAEGELTQPAKAKHSLRKVLPG